MNHKAIGILPGHIHVPTLSGYASSLSEKLDLALAIYMVAAHDLSYCWGEVPSLSRAMQLSGNSVTSLVNVLQNQLEVVLRTKFKMVRVEVEEDPQFINAAMTKINITIDIQDNGHYEKSVRILEIADGKFNRLIKLHTGI